ncbi:MAG: hypothetical protein Q8M39_08635 [Sulfuricurvum sp.]|nr:hypothetical protein [Sulfuricurvum sp.]
MKREVTREKIIPSFLIGISELEALIDRMSLLFNQNDRINISISISIPFETLEFNSVQELREYSDIKGKTSEFRIWLNQDNKRISIHSTSKTFFYSVCDITAKGDSEAWCAGAIETVYSFLSTYRVWYSWLRSVPLGWIIFIFMNIPTFMKWYSIDKYSLNNPLIIAWIATFSLLLFLYFFKHKLLPSATLVITEKEGYIQRHIGEIGLILAVLSTTLTFISLFVNK